MPEHDILLASEFESLVSERNAVWSDFDSATQNAAKLQSLRGRVSQIPSGAIAQPIKSEDAPPDELAKSVRQLELELSQIERLQNAIRGEEAAISEIESHYRTMLMWSIIAVIVIVVILVMSLL